MPQAPWQMFLNALEPHRDALWTRARAAVGTDIQAEGLLQAALHEVFPAYLKSATPDPTPAVNAALNATAEKKKLTLPHTPAEPLTPMPAATWARLAGALQVEAARIGGVTALNPDSVLLSPDPLLAPRKSRPADNTPDTPPASHWMLVTGIIVALGIAVTIYLSTRPSAPPQPATTAPAVNP